MSLFGKILKNCKQLFSKLSFQVGEISTLLIFLSLGIMVVGAFITNVAQKKSLDIRSLADDSTYHCSSNCQSGRYGEYAFCYNECIPGNVGYSHAVGCQNPFSGNPNPWVTGFPQRDCVCDRPPSCSNLTPTSTMPGTPTYLPTLIPSGTQVIVTPNPVLTTMPTPTLDPIACIAGQDRPPCAKPEAWTAIQDITKDCAAGDSLKQRFALACGSSCGIPGLQNCPFTPGQVDVQTQSCSGVQPPTDCGIISFPVVATIAKPPPNTEVPTVSTNPSLLPSDCSPIEVHGSQEDKLDVVILGDEYSSKEEFINAAKWIPKGFGSTNFPGYLYQKLNFYANTDLSTDFQVTQDLVWNTNKAVEQAQHCNADAYILMTKRYTTTNTGDRGGVAFVYYDGVSWTGSMESLVLASEVVNNALAYTVPHELGHAIVGLYDEYDTQRGAAPSAYRVAPDNCSIGDTSVVGSNCQKWKEEFLGDSSIGCFPVCGYSDWYRPTYSSIMNGKELMTGIFNAPSLQGWEKALESYK